MSVYLKANGDTVQVYPYYLSQLPKEYPNTSFPDNMTPEFLAGYHVYAVQQMPQPPYDKLQQKVVEAIPSKVAGVWQQQWSVVEMTPEEQAHALLVARNAAALSPAQFRIALFDRLWLDRVNEYINREETPEQTKIMYNYATVFERMNPLLLQLAVDMGFSDAQLDDLFNIRG